MRFLSILSFLAATSMAAQVTIHNKCSTAVWLKPDSAGAIGTPSQARPPFLPHPNKHSTLSLSTSSLFLLTNKPKPIPIPTKSAWITDLKGTGNAFKLAPSLESLDKPIQFDYSVGPDGLTYYDVTDGVGNPFPLLAHGDDCPQVQCPAGPDLCKTTKSCPKDKNLHVYACP